MADRKLVLDILARDRGAKRTLDGVADAADGAGREFDEMSAAAKSLDSDLEKTEQAMRSLATQMAGMDRGSAKFAELRKEFNLLQREAGGLKRLRKTFGDVGDESAQELALSFSQRIGPLLARAPVSPPLVGAIVGASPVIGAAVAGAVVAGLTAGTVGAGMATAFKHSSVQKAGRDLARDFESTLTNATAEFVPATISGIGLLRKEIRGMGPELRDVFKPAAGYVGPLIQGVTRLVSGVLPGVADVLGRAGPVVDGLVDGMAFLGDQAGEALSAISEGSDGAGMAIRDLLMVTAMGVRALGETVGFLSKMYGYMRIATASDKAAALQQLVDGQMAAAQMQSAFAGLTGGVREYSSATASAAYNTRSLTEAQQEAADVARGAFDAETNLANAKREATQAAKGLNDGIRTSSAEGLKAREVLSTYAAEITESIGKYEAQNGVTAKSIALQRENYGAFMRLAAGMRVPKEQAEALASEFRLLGGELARLNGRTVRINVDTHFRTFGKPGTAVGGIGSMGFKGLSKGGPIEGPGPRGVDSVPIMGAPGEGVLNLKGMAAIGGKRGLAALNNGTAMAATAVPAAARPTRTAAAAAAAPVTINLYAGVVGSRQQLETILAGAIDDLRRKGRL